MSEIIKYDDLTHTNFPLQEDKLKYIRDPKDSEIPLINEYNTYMASGQYIKAYEFLNQHPTLTECIINADLLLSLHHSIIALQRFFNGNVLEHIYHLGQQKGDWNENMSSDATSEALKLNMYDIVRYPIDGLNQYFMVISSNIVAGTLPIDRNYYVQMSMKGDKGDRGTDGYTPQKGVDYWDGESGTGLSPCGAWIADRTYTKYDLVSYDGDLWYLKSDSSVNEIPINSEYWEKILLSVKMNIGKDVEDNLDDSGLWLHQQEHDEQHIIVKTKISDGSFLTLYPETKEAYITDNNGNNLQEKLYYLYFNRLDVHVKIHVDDNNGIYSKFAYLVDTDICVASYIVTDTLDENGTIKTTFTVYDETGEIELYIVGEIITEMQNDDGTIDYDIVNYREFRVPDQFLPSM